MLKYNFLDSYLLCFVYKFFAVLYLRIRLFALLTAWKGNGTGVYAEISFPEFYNFFLFILFHFIFSLVFIYPRHLPTSTPTPTTHTHDPRPTTFSYTLVFVLCVHSRKRKLEVFFTPSVTPLSTMCGSRAVMALQPPRYYGHFFWPPGKTVMHFLVKMTSLIRSPVNRAKLFWPTGTY